MIDIRSFRDLIRLLFIFKHEVKLAIIITIIVAILGAFLLPLQYSSEARLLVKQGRENTTLPIDASNRQALLAPTTVRDPIVDEEKMLTGLPVMKQVAEKYLVLMESAPPPTGQWKIIKAKIKAVLSSGLDSVRDVLISVGLVDEKTDIERITKKLKKSFSAEHASGSSVIEVRLTWDDPYVAQKIIEFWIEVYLEERTKALSRSSSLYDFYMIEKEDSASELKAIQLELNEKLSKVGAADIDNRISDLATRLNLIRNSRSDAVIELASIQAGLQQMLTLRKGLPLEIMVEQEIGLNPSKLDLKKQLNELNLEKVELLRVFNEGSEPIVQIEQGIAVIEQQISSLSERILHTENRAPNSAVRSIDDKVLSKKTTISELVELINNYDSELLVLEASLQKLLAEKPQIKQLNSKLLAAQQNYALYLENFEKARIDQELDRGMISNIAIIEEASLNNGRVFPKSLNILIMAGPIALIVGGFVLYICFLLDKRIHDGDRVEEYFKVKLWSSIRHMTDKAPINDSEFQASLYRIYSLLPLDKIAENGLNLALTSSKDSEGVSYVAKYLSLILEEEGLNVSLNSNQRLKNQVNIIKASSVINNSSALVQLKQADMIVLIIEAAGTTIPTVEHSLTILTTAFNKIDGVILNKKRFEIPSSWWSYFSSTKNKRAI